MNSNKKIFHDPAIGVSSLYFAMGLPFVGLNMVAAILYKDLDVSDAQIAFWTSLVMWPWTIKFLWSPFLELYRTKKFFVVATRLARGAGTYIRRMTLGGRPLRSYRLSHDELLGGGHLTFELQTDK